MLCPSLMPAASCGGVGRKSPVLLLLSKKKKTAPVRLPERFLYGMRTK